MSKGSKIISLRPGNDRLEAMQRYVASYNDNATIRPPIDLTEFIRRAIDEKLAHAARSNSKGRKRAPRIESAIAKSAEDDADGLGDQ